ncbi:ammonium transporter [Synechococcus sp. Nb3U1]|uniref:ammonium transporter n=1 Tax=Synechococcus sp. Nb3U1 TaxID=1914529 RepID=UPI001F48AF43|nr:ammonium transporter [Synechococcus sp. Nb3U1]MCF2969806.1 ammonium transporter [Synechococcus sp. Nb3U1]
MTNKTIFPRGIPWRWRGGERLPLWVGVLLGLGGVAAPSALAQTDLTALEQALPAEAWAELQTLLQTQQYHADIVWTIVAGVLVFFMQAGFAMVEAGFTRAKNAANIVLKNLMDFCCGACAFWALGFGLMFGSHVAGFLGTDWFFFNWQQGSEAGSQNNAWPFTFFCFQLVFAATAATIVSGAMAERTRFVAYLIYSIVISAVIYPISGGWAWNGLFADYNGGSAGWLENLGYIDFAGSGVVHLVGGAAAFAGTLALGPRLGKYSAAGDPRAIPGHSLPLGMLGVLILWMGWIGFNAGSTTAAIPDIGWIAFNTYLAGAAGAIGAMCTSWAIFTKPDMTFAANGALAGLVGITAPCATVHPLGALLVGSISGVLVVLSVLFIEGTLKVDDPVGAVSVHGVCGAWGVIAAGIPWFAHAEAGVSWGGLPVQVLGVIALGGWSFVSCLVLFLILKGTIGLRVSAEEELAGLDIGEHGNIAYPDFASASSELER